MTKSKYLRKKKRTQIINRKLVKLYPWLIPRNWKGKVVKDYDYTWHEAHSMGSGWWKAFGLMLCRDIQQALKRGDCVEKYRISEVKEKYGELRWYSYHETDEISRIIDKYSHVSRHVCWFCGRPDVAITNAGWILPICEECYKKQEWSNLGYADVICVSDPNEISLSFTILHGTKDESWEETIDVTDIVEEIRRSWNKRERKRLKRRAKRQKKISGEHN